MALRLGGTAPAVLNAANEVAVQTFLGDGIPFTGIQRVVQETLGQHKRKLHPRLDDIIDADKWARQKAGELCLNSELKR